jgi:septal ring factor EnvC (AmiA/AmiB activator)
MADGIRNVLGNDEITDDSRSSFAGLLGPEATGDVTSGREIPDRKSSRVRFDPTFSLGSILTLAGILVGVGGSYGTLRADQARDQEKAEMRWQETQRDIGTLNARLSTFDNARTTETGSLNELSKEMQGVTTELRYLHDGLDRVVTRLDQQHARLNQVMP